MAEERIFRRTLLAGGLAAGGAVVLSACGGSTSSCSAPVARPGTGPTHRCTPGSTRRRRAQTHQAPTRRGIGSSATTLDPSIPATTRPPARCARGGRTAAAAEAVRAPDPPLRPTLGRADRDPGVWAARVALDRAAAAWAAAGRTARAAALPAAARADPAAGRATPVTAGSSRVGPVGERPVDQGRRAPQQRDRQRASCVPGPFQGGCRLSAVLATVTCPNGNSPLDIHLSPSILNSRYSVARNAQT